MGVLNVDGAQDILQTRFAPWVLDLDLSVSATTEDSITIRMCCNQSHLIHGTQVVSGQALMALADTAMVVAFSCAGGEFVPVATVDQNTSFMRPATDSAIVACAQIVRRGRSLGFASCRLTTGDDRLVATAVGTYAMPPA